MIRCTFHLNGSSLSNLSCPGIGFFPAYSGLVGPLRNNADAADVPDSGPLPPGRYHIVARPGSGAKHFIKDLAYSAISGSNHFLWLALYREDSSIDDHTFINDVERGNFRLHPAGWRGISKGCITFVNSDHYNIFLSAVLSTPSTMITSQLESFGTVQVY